jgi:hypothetical protein
MNWQNMFVGSAFIGIFLACWNYIKGISWRVIGMLVDRVEIHDENCAKQIVGYLVNNFKMSKVYERVYDCNFEHIKNGRVGLVAYEVYGKKNLIFWNGWFPLYFSGCIKTSKATNQEGGSNYAESNSKSTATILFIRNTIKIDEIIKNSISNRNEVAWSAEELTAKVQRRFFIKHIPPIRENEEGGKSPNSKEGYWYRMPYYRIIGVSPDDLGRRRITEESALDFLLFPPHIKEMIEEIKMWRQNRDWYRKRGIPWKRGWLFYGKPGTGKTALTRAFAEDLDLPIYAFNLAEIGNAQFMRYWLEMQQHVPCIALFEDIDNVFHGRENVVNRKNSYMRDILEAAKAMKTNKDGAQVKGTSKKSGEEDSIELGYGRVNFDVFLNCLDGVDRGEGVFTIITTNDLSAIDEALGVPRKQANGEIDFISTRPGRIDKAIELKSLRPEDKIIMATRILGDYPEELEKLCEYIKDYQGEETPAQFQERCAQIALRCRYRDFNEGKTLGD